MIRFQRAAVAWSSWAGGHSDTQAHISRQVRLVLFSHVSRDARVFICIVCDLYNILVAQTVGANVPDSILAIKLIVLASDTGQRKNLFGRQAFRTMEARMLHTCLKDTLSIV